MLSTIFWISLAIGSVSTATEATFQKNLHRPGLVFADSFKGDATFMTPGLGACERMSQESQLVAAINQPQFGNPKRGRDGVWCGKCVEVSASDFGTTVIVEVVDRSDGQEGHLVLSETAFSQLASIDEGRIEIQWKRITCGRNLTGRSIKTNGSGRSFGEFSDPETSGIV